MLGDTAWITSDSSIFSSIDSFGYRLYFPHAYQINNQFTIAVNHNSNLRVSVDSLYTDTINGALDSLAFLFLKAYDSANTSNPNHYLDSAELVISKKNGLIKTADFTDRFEKIMLEQYFKIQPEYTNRDKFELTVGDEYHYTIFNSYFPSFLENHILKVIKDSLNGNQGMISYEDSWKKVQPTPDSLKVDTFQRVFLNRQVAFDNYSQIVRNDLTTFQFRTDTIAEFSVYNNCVQSQFNQLYHATNTYSVFSFNGVDDSLENPISNSGSNYKLLIGIDYEYGSWGAAGQGAGSVRKSIVYVKKGNQSWGTPLSLSVGVDEVTFDSNKIKVYPNPTKNQITISAKEAIRIISVFNIHGKKVKEIYAPQEMSFQLPLEGPSGIYFVQVQLKNGVVIAKKVVKE